MQTELTQQSLREKIIGFEKKLSDFPDAFFGDSDFCPLTHSFSDGIYVREIRIPADTYLTGKIHRNSHPIFLMEGEIIIITEHGGEQRLVAPMSMMSKEGTKRAAYTVTDTWWITVHSVGEERDLKKIEEMVIAKDYKEYKKYIESKNNLVHKIKGFIKKLLN